MLNECQRIEIRAVINESLDRAERHWKKGGHELVEKSGLAKTHSIVILEDQEPSKIPGHNIVQDDETVIDEFIAFVADMRDSSKHLMCEISQKTASASGLERVFYETSALLPALALAVQYEDGNVTEYLGDGVLALFRVNPEKADDAIYAAHRSAKNSIRGIRDIVNDILNERYGLPVIDLGVGLSLSKTLVTLVGLPKQKQPKAFGECVFRATKLSGGRNQILADRNLRIAWPKRKGGSLVFKQKSMKGVNGYLLSKAE